MTGPHLDAVIAALRRPWTCFESTLFTVPNMFQVSMSPATAAGTRRDGEGGGYCRKWTTAAWRKWRVKDLRTALLQVRQRRDERKRTSMSSFPPSLHPEQWGRWENKKSETNDHPTCSVSPHLFHCLMWGNPDCEVRWFPMSSGYSRRWHSGCLSGFHCGSLSRVSRILQVQSSLSPCFPAPTLSSSLPFPSSAFPSCFPPIVVRSQG